MSTEKRQYTRGEVARFRAIAAKRKAQGTTTTDSVPKGEVVKMPKKFVLQDVAPFDAMIGFTETNRGTTQGDNPRSFTTLKGVEFTVAAGTFTRTCMAYGEASEAINAQLDAGATTLEVELTPNYNTMKITGLVIDGVFTAFPDERPEIVREAA
jgi:hypothetical protein